MGLSTFKMRGHGWFVCNATVALVPRSVKENITGGLRKMALRFPKMNTPGTPARFGKERRTAGKPSDIRIVWASDTNWFTKTVAGEGA